MRAMSSSSKSWFSRALVLALAAGSATASAQSLPKGYASDESPTAPAVTVTAAAPTPAPVMKATATDTAAVTATAQISTSADEYSDTDPSALTDFQEPLQGYGAWVDDPTYGTVWVPDTTVVGADFAPYQTEGYWSLTDDGEWLWVSTYDWGYVPFHYGRWVWISGRGWSWIPGRTYAPAWVAWRVSDYGYIGWAPMSPLYYWSGGSAVYFTSVPAAAYVFCPTSYVFHTHVHSYVVKDKATVKSVAAHSRNYKPASPGASASGSGGSSGKYKPAEPSSSSAGSGNKSGSSGKIVKPSGPSMKEAGIADSVVPKKRAAADSRAQLFSKKSTTPKAKAAVKAQRSASLASAGSSPVSRAGRSGGFKPGGSSTSLGSSGATAGGVAARPSSPPTPVPQPSRGHSSVIRTPSGSAGSAAVSRAPANVSRPHGSTPTTVSRPSTPSVSRPSTPSVSRPSTPSVSRPSTPSVSRSSTPSVSRPSAPSVSRSSGGSAPRSSGGSSHSGGGSRGGGRR